VVGIQDQKGAIYPIGRDFRRSFWFIALSVVTQNGTVAQTVIALEEPERGIHLAYS